MTMRSSSALFLAAALAFGTAAHANSWLVGAGAHTCGKYAEFYRQNPQLAEELFYAWTQGFLSGTNVAFSITLSSYADLGAKSEAEEQQFLRAYCNDHPLANFSDAVEELYKQFPTQRVQPDRNSTSRQEHLT